MSQKVLITGASSGFGKLFTQTLLKQGHAVWASMRAVDGRNREAAAELRAAGAHVVEIDVTDDASVDRGVGETIRSAGGLDVLVNNAGLGVLGLQECFEPKDWRSLFEVNVFGVQRVNRAALPVLREQGSGLLIHVSSLLGRFVMPFFGPYNASKWALEALAENYRVELSAFGVDSVIVEPGGFGTNFMDSLMKPSDTKRSPSYGPMAAAPEQFLQGFEGNLTGDNAPDPQLVADAVAKLIDTPAGQRPFRTVVDGLGMGEPIERLNQVSKEITTGLYGAFEMSDMLKLKV